MEDGAVGHRTRQIGAEAAVHRHRQLQGGQAAAVIEADRVIVGKGVALAGDVEVIVAIQPQLHRPPGFGGSQRSPHGQMPGLGFLAAKTATHAPAFHTHGVVVQAQRVGHPMLHFTGVLGAAVDQPLVLLLRQGIGHLAF